MKDKDLLIELYNEMKNEYQEYLRYFHTIRKLNGIIEGNKEIIDLNSSDLELFDDDCKNIIENIKYISLFQLGEYSKEETNNSLVFIKEQLIKKIKKDVSYYDKLYKNLKYLSNLEESFNDIQNNYSLIMEFIEFCYKEKKITLEQAISLNLDIVNAYIIKKDNDDVVEEIIEENEEPIYEQLEELFEKYGYDFNELEKKVREKFNKYVKLDYTEYILSKLFEFGVTKEEVKSYQKTIFKIIIDKKNTFDEICEFINNNDCTMSKMLSFDTMFHKKKVKYIQKNKKHPHIIDTPPKSETDLTIIGTYDDSIKNIELLKNNTNIGKITNKFLENKQVFINTQHSKIIKNLEILREYGIIGKNEFPDDVSCLIGIFTGYQLDRFIEVGLEDYIKTYPSYVNKTKSPFKFYKIRRGNDLGDTVVFGRGMYKKFTDDNNSYEGISRVQIDDEIKINQQYLKYEQLRGIPQERKRTPFISRHERLSSTEYLKRLYKDGYRYQEFTSHQIFHKTELTFSYVIDTILKNDDYNVDYVNTDIYNNDYIKALDNYICETNEGSYPLKQDNNTYVFRPYKFPNLGIIISRQKVLRLCNLLNQSGILMDKNLTYDTKINVILSAVVKDSIISYWEFNYIRHILKSVFESFKNEHKDSNERRAK